MPHHLKLQPAPFAQIKAGTKTIEMRLWDEKRQHYQVGDELVFTKLPDQTETLTRTITGLHRFPNFTAMCQALPLTQMGYAGESLTAWQTNQDHGMYHYYSPEDEAKFGVVGIELKG